MRELSVIVVSWNTADLLRRCLHSLYAELEQLDSRSWQTFVVDNASSDGTVAMINHDFPWVTLIENQDNAGFARANNQAARRSDSRYLLLLNPDTYFHPGSLSTLIRFMCSHADAGAAGPRLLNTDGTLQVSAAPLPTLTRELWYLFHLDQIYHFATYDQGGWPHDQARPVGSLKGACIILRADILAGEDLFDEAFFVYSEEVDLCRRIGHAGWKLYWVPQAQIDHHAGQSTRQVAPAMFLQLYQSKLIYFRKHNGPIAAAAYKAILVLASLPRIILAPFAGLLPLRHGRSLRNKARNYRSLLGALWRM